MSVNVEWDVPMTIHSPYADVELNTPFASATTGVTWLYQTAIDGYQIVPAKFRPVSDSLSQTDGSSIQPPYIDGLVATLEVGYWICPDGTQESKEPACKANLREMNEYLMGALNSLRTYPSDPSTQQYLWTPSGVGTQRLLDGVMLGTWPTPDFTKGPPEVRLKFDLASPYPYALNDAAVTTGPIAPGGTAYIDNVGNSPELPIVMVTGPSSFFKVTNILTGLSITYDASLPGALAVPNAETLQIDFHTGLVFIQPTISDNYIAGLNPAASTLFALLPGENTIYVDPGSDADVTIVSFSAWV